MLDLNYVRENLNGVIKALRNRGFPDDRLLAFHRADQERRAAIQSSDSYNADLNRASQEIGELIKQGKKDDAIQRRSDVKALKEHVARLNHERDEAEARMKEILVQLPNIPHESVPVGKDESANVEVRRWGTKREFDFEPKDHV